MFRKVFAGSLTVALERDVETLIYEVKATELAMLPLLLATILVAALLPPAYR